VSRSSNKQTAAKKQALPRQSDNIVFLPFTARRGGPEPMAAVFELPPGPGIWCGVEGCVDPLHRFLFEPRKQSETVLVTRLRRLVAAMAVSRPEVHYFVIDDSVAFLRAQGALQKRCVNCSCLLAEPGMTVEETLVAVEELASGGPDGGRA
jgi:hypothetical protein